MRFSAIGDAHLFQQVDGIRAPLARPMRRWLDRLDQLIADR
jgi:hypothetical protein